MEDQAGGEAVVEFIGVLRKNLAATKMEVVGRGGIGLQLRELFAKGGGIPVAFAFRAQGSAMPVAFARGS